MKITLLRASLLALSLTTILPMTTQAHRAWMLPSATVLSGAEPWLTVDAAVSNDLFYFEHQPMRMDGIEVIAPDGTEAKIENASTGRYRSTFDVKLTQKGTYKVTRVSENINASYVVDGELKHFRGTSETFANEVPADAQDLQVAKTRSRLEVFVTSGNPSDTVLKTTGMGLELSPITHPNDLFAGETASFRLLSDGKPQAGTEVTIVPGGIRYRNQVNEIKTTTDQNGNFSVTWPAPGMYWLNASVSNIVRSQIATPSVPAGGAPTSPMSRPVNPGTRTSYTATLEVLPQ
ncbi:MAG: DUF4198 domain-containing protein [Steroidobacteraceae bacterium]